MGFIASAETITVIAKLTPYGRQQLLTNSSSIITKFSLGDSDANYTGDAILSRGKVPTIAGEIGANNLFSNGVYSGVRIKSPVIVNSAGGTKKNVEAGSSSVVITPKTLGVSAVTGTTLTQFIINRTLGDTDGNTNLFYSFGLPIIQADKNKYTTFTSPVGYLDTAIKDFNKDKVLVISMENCDYGEIIDGKTVKIQLTTTGGTPYTLYSTFQKSLTPLTSVDTQVKELLELGNAIGTNIAFLFSDTVKRPNNDPTKSWATGYGTIKPFSISGKPLFNSVSVPSTSTVVDSAIGVVYLDKGIIVITHPDIVNNYNTTTGSTTVVTYNSISNEVAQNITCIVERGEFSSTNNTTYTAGESIRVTEIALYDTYDNVVAYAKTNEPILIAPTQFLALGVRILV